MNGIDFMKKNLPAILTGLSVVSTAGAVYFTYEKAPEINAVISDKSLTKGQRFLGIAKAGAIPITLFMISAGCSIGAQVINTKRLTTMAGQLTTATTAAALATKELKTLSDKTKEVVGEEKYNEIREEVAKDKAAHTNGKIEPVGVTQVEHVNTPGGGNTLWYDERHDRWFRTSPSNVEAAIKKFNKGLLAYDFASYGELYANLCLTVPPSDERIGFTSWNCPNGICLNGNIETIEYPETGEIARVFQVEQYPELDPDWTAGSLL